MTENLTRLYIDEIIDGSTFIGWFEMFDIRVRKKVKLVNIKCHSTTVTAGQEARKFVVELLSNKETYCTTFRDKFRKWSTILIVLYVKDGNECINVNDVLIKKAMAFQINGNHEQTPDND